VYAFVVLKDGVTDPQDEIVKDLQQLVATQIGRFAVPQSLLVSWLTSTSSCSVPTSSCDCLDTMNDAFLLHTDCPWPSQDTFCQDHASYLEEDCFQPAWWAGGRVYVSRPLRGGAHRSKTHPSKTAVAIANKLNSVYRNVYLCCNSFWTSGYYVYTFSFVRISVNFTTSVK